MISNEKSYIQVPLELFNGSYTKLSTDAKLLYSLFLERTKLCKLYNWVNSKGEIFIIFPNEEAQAILSVTRNTYTQILNELKKYELIDEEEQCQGQPNLIYIHHIAGGESNA